MLGKITCQRNNVEQFLTKVANGTTFLSFFILFFFLFSLSFFSYYFLHLEDIIPLCSALYFSCWKPFNLFGLLQVIYSFPLASFRIVSSFWFPSVSECGSFLFVSSVISFLFLSVNFSLSSFLSHDFFKYISFSLSFVFGIW